MVLIHQATTTYFFGGETKDGITSSLNTQMRRYQISTSGSLDLSRVDSEDEPNNTTISNLYLLSSTFLLSIERLRIRTTSSLSITKTSTSGTLFQFLACLSDTLCVATDYSPASIGLYLVDSTNFFHASNLPVSLTQAQGAAPAQGLAAYPSATLVAACSAGQCHIFSAATSSLSLLQSFSPAQASVTSVRGFQASSTHLVLALVGGAPNALHFYALDPGSGAASLVTRLQQSTNSYLSKEPGQVQEVGSADSLISRSALAEGDQAVSFYRKKQCHATCATCFGGLDTNCLTCAVGSVDGAGSCLTCDANCLTCSGTATTCTSCTAGKNVDAVTSSCVACGAGSFVKPADNKCYSCNANCLTCSGTATTCTSCTAGLFLTASSSCSACTAPGFFQSVAGSLCLACDASCLTCSAAASTACLSCAAPAVLSTGQCVTTRSSTLVGLKAVLNPHKKHSADFSLLVSFADLPAQFAGSAVAKSLLQSANTPLEFVEQVSGQAEKYSAKVEFVLVGESAVLDYTFTSALSKPKYSVKYSAVLKSLSRILQSEDLELKAEEFHFEYENTKFVTEELKTSAEQGQVVGALTGGLGSSSPALAESISAAASLDPTGLITRFSQIIKIFNRIYYINVDFGSKLNAFLEGVDRVANTKKKTFSDIKYLSHSKGYRGKLTLKKITGDFYYEFSWRVLLYFASWFTKSGLRFLTGRRLRVWLLYVAYFVPRLHLMIFNAVLLDFTFYATISAAHFSLFPSSWLSAVCLLVLQLDLLDMVGMAKDKNIWLYYLRVKKHQFSGLNEPAKSRTDTGLISPKRIKIDRKSNSRLSDLISPKKRTASQLPIMENAELKPVIMEIDYEKTWENINMNVHLMAFFTTPLKTETKVYDSRLSRNLVLLHFLRMFAYQLLIPIGQYMPGSTILALLSLEIMKISLAIYIQFKYRAMVDPVVVLTETAQHFFMTVFLVLAFAINMHNSKNLGQVDSIYQSIGIVVILVAIVLEYLLIVMKMILVVVALIRSRISKNGTLHLKFGWFIYHTTAEQSQMIGSKDGSHKDVQNAVIIPRISIIQKFSIHQNRLTGSKEQRNSYRGNHRSSQDSVELYNLIMIESKRKGSFDKMDMKANRISETPYYKKSMFKHGHFQQLRNPYTDLDSPQSRSTSKRAAPATNSLWTKEPRSKRSSIFAP